jgi:hypothetical protein
MVHTQVRKVLLMRNFILFSFLLSLSPISCNSKEPEDKSLVLALISLNSRGESKSSIKTCTTPTPTCSVPSNFTFIGNIQANSKYSTCTNCHGVNNTYGNFDFTSYNDTLTRINVSQPSESLLWQKVASCYPSVGSMGVHSDQTFNDLIYCWIQEGGQQ